MQDHIYGGRPITPCKRCGFQFTKEERVVHQVRMQISQPDELDTRRFLDWCNGADISVRDSCGVLTADMSEGQYNRFHSWNNQNV